MMPHSRGTPDKSGRCATGACLLPDKSGVPLVVSRCALQAKTNKMALASPHTVTYIARSFRKI
jgi:hypothetical protein